MEDIKIVIKEKIKNHDHINNLDLRSDLEEGNKEFCYFSPMGCINSEEETYAIDCFLADGTVVESYIYTSEEEYMQDCELLGMVKRTHKVWTSIEEHTLWANEEEEYREIDDIPTSLGEFTTLQQAIDQAESLSDAHMNDGDVSDAIEEFLGMNRSGKDSRTVHSYGEPFICHNFFDAGVEPHGEGIEIKREKVVVGQVYNLSLPDPDDEDATKNFDDAVKLWLE